MLKEIEKIRSFLLDYVSKNNLKGYCLGISGGVDSSVLFKILEPLDIDVTAVIMPINSIMQDENHARLLTENTKKNVIKVDLTDVYNQMIQVLPKSDNKMSYANIKPRLRMTTLYQIAQSNQLLVAGASNKAEYMLGYFTKYGDSGVDVLPLVEFKKSEIYEMAKVLGVPSEIIDKPPSAGLYEGQSDEKEMGILYKDIDDYLDGKLEDKTINSKIEKMYNITNHKRQLPIIYKR